MFASQDQPWLNNFSTQYFAWEPREYFVRLSYVALYFLLLRTECTWNSCELQMRRIWSTFPRVIFFRMRQTRTRYSTSVLYCITCICIFCFDRNYPRNYRRLRKRTLTDVSTQKTQTPPASRSLSKTWVKISSSPLVCITYLCAIRELALIFDWIMKLDKILTVFCYMVVQLKLF